MFNSAILAGVCLAGLANAALAQSNENLISPNEPLSAIDWLTQIPTVTIDIAREAPVAEGGNTPQISVSPLEQSGRDAVGLLPGTVTGLPNSLWQNSQAQDLAGLIQAMPDETLPAIQALLYTLLLAEANPPFDAEGNDALLLARIDKLVALGAIDQAHALINRATPDRRDLFKRWFDVSLLIGDEQRACETLGATQHLAPNYAARVFCLARTGNWDTAVLTLNTAKTLGLVTETQDALLIRFLDPDLFADEPLLLAATDPDPLQFRLMEAIAEPLLTPSLPRAYAHADLRDNIGWKAQLEAAERLARVGALPESQLFGAYLENKPAASGAIWDRVSGIQSFESSLERADSNDISAALSSVWPQMSLAHLEVPFAKFYGPKLLENADLASSDLARIVGLLGPSYETAAAKGPSDFLARLAQGDPPSRSPDPTRQAIANAYHGAGVPQNWSNRLARGQLGEVILQAMISFQQGAAGDLRALTNALATFRAVGLEDTARQASLQVLILERDY